MRKKFVIWVTVINLIVLAIVIGFTLKIINDNYRNSVLDSLEKQCVIANELFKQSGDYDATAALVGNLTGSRVTIISSSGEVLADSQTDKSSLGSHDTREEVINARNNNGIGSATRYSDTLKKDVMYVAMPMNSSGVIVRVSQPVDSILDNISNMWQSIALISAFSILAITLFTIWIMSRIVSPVNKLIEATNEIIKGNYKKRVFVRGEKEINELAYSFNKMVDELEDAISGLKGENTKLETVLNAIGNGVIAVDDKMTIVMLNQKAKELLRLNENALSNNVLIASRNATLEAMLKKCKEDNISFNKEINVIRDNKEIKLLFVVAPIERDGVAKGAVAVIEDVTELRKLEISRSEFAANVSHELKTPLTIIRGFVDTLKEGAIKDEKKAEKFLDIINIETDRLTRLISDILYLSEIESDSIQVEMDKVDLVDSAKEVVNMLSNTAEEKNISLKIIGDQSVLILGNKDRIKQLILNLVDNAIKYTNAKDTVTISLYSKDNKSYLEVKDNGVGISEKDLERLFERFYRADKSRSRELGGTGLGLAIVKHIAISHGGEIVAQSKPQEGSTFRIIFPGYNSDGKSDTI